MIVFESRACTVLFNAILSHPIEGPFLLPANICPIVPMVFMKAKRAFEFVDIAPSTLCIDHDALLYRWNATGTRPAGVLYGRTYGAIFDTDGVFEQVKSLSPSALIIDDRCLCAPDFNDMLAPHTDIALYSTGYAKFANVGYGGFGVLKEDLPYLKADLPFDEASLARATASYQGALDGQKLFSYDDCDWLDTTAPSVSFEAYRELVHREALEVKKLKDEINLIYSSRLPVEIQLPTAFQTWRFNIHVRDKAQVLTAIRQAGFFASDHYHALTDLFGPGKSPYAKMVHKHVINIFNDRFFSLEKAERLTEFLRKMDISPSDNIVV